MGPCMCGALDCRSCGRAQGTYYLHGKYKYGEFVDDCGYEKPEYEHNDVDDEPEWESSHGEFEEDAGY